ncbi:hypothetical protein BGZ63DRAFT_429682 [Mariannaea sp. PMI_226]|nr:hypothetical protein BGZ63DRAFT_429682 [Mariannaea sp. PMI_226]
MPGTLLITRPSGYPGSNLIKEALDNRYNIRATVRSEASAKKIVDQFAQYADPLSYAIGPDMTKVEFYEHGLQGIGPAGSGCTGLRDHPGGGAPLGLVGDPHRRDVEPRVVCVLSKVKRLGYVYDEKDWNLVTFEEAAVADGVAAYCTSEVLAERAVWEWVAKNKPNFEVATITPPWIFGPYCDGADIDQAPDRPRRIRLLARQPQGPDTLGRLPTKARTRMMADGSIRMVPSTSSRYVSISTARCYCDKIQKRKPRILAAPLQRATQAPGRRVRTSQSMAGRRLRRSRRLFDPRSTALLRRMFYRYETCSNSSTLTGTDLATVSYEHDAADDLHEGVDPPPAAARLGCAIQLA